VVLILAVSLYHDIYLPGEVLGIIRATGGGFGISGRKIGEEGSGKGILGTFKIGNKPELKQE
jgi:hypothetical protein